jgi:hypothetical protein
MLRGIFAGVLDARREGQHHAWMAAPALTGETPTADFLVLPPNGEMDQVAVDVAELSAAAETTGGNFYTLANARDLPQDLPRGRHVRLESLTPISLWNQWWFVLALLSTLITEWALQRWCGVG